MAKHRVTTDETHIRECIASTNSIRQAIFKSGLTAKVFRNRAKELGIYKTNQFWNRGLTSETDERVKKNATAISTALKGKPGHPHSKDAKRRMSEKRIAFLESNSNHGIKWYDVQNTAGINFRLQGMWEKTVGEWLNQQGILWTRKYVCFCGHRRYTADFFLPEVNEFLEVKGYLRHRDLYKMFLVKKDNPDIKIRLLEKVHYQRLSKIVINDIPMFDVSHSFTEIDFAAFKNIWAAEGNRHT